MKQINKAIAYAYATSEIAEKMGFASTGCYFIEKMGARDDGSTAMWADYKVGGFTTICADLRKSFEEAGGAVCAMSLKYNSEYYGKIAR